MHVAGVSISVHLQSIQKSASESSSQSVPLLNKVGSLESIASKITTQLSSQLVSEITHTDNIVILRLLMQFKQEY